MAVGLLVEMLGITGVSFGQARVPCFQSMSGFQVCNQGNPRIRELCPIPAIISSNVIDQLLTRILRMTKWVIVPFLFGVPSTFKAFSGFGRCFWGMDRVRARSG